MSQATPSDLALAFAEMSLRAGEAIMDVREAGVKARKKADASPVTEADERAEAIILTALAELLPSTPVLAEEAASRGEHFEAEETFLLVDPLDGTKEFVNGRDDFTVNIALIEAGAPKLGCVYAPARRACFLGDVETGAWRATLSPSDTVSAGAFTPISVRKPPAAGLTAMVSRSHLDPKTEAFLKTIPLNDDAAAGSSLKFCRVAEGAADVYPRFGPTMEWDTGAGQAVLAAAGGLVTTPEGAPFGYGKTAEGYRNGAFIAWGGYRPN